MDNYVHRVEKARERSDELFDEFKSMNDTLADHRKTVSELAARYDELSKGVNLSTNDNVSLSTEEYEEFLDINEQLAQSFPELAKGIDENGNSILTLGTKGITAKEELEELLQTEEDLNNFRIAQEIGDAFKGVYTYVEEANEATEKLNSTITDSSEAMNKLQDVAENGIKLTGENGQLIFAGNTNNQAELVYMNSLTASANEFWKSLDGNRRVELDTLGINAANLFSFNQDEYTGAFEVYSQAFSLTPEELTALENIIQDNVGDASGALLDSISDKSQELQGQVQQGENAWRDFIPNLVSGMKSKQTFKDLDSDLQDIAVQIVEGLDYSYATAMREWNPNDPYAYIRDNLIVPMGNLSNDDKQIVKDSFTKLMTLDAEDITDSNREAITDLIAKIADILEKDELEIRVALGFDVGDDAKKRLQHSIRQITDDRGLADRKQVSELNEYTKDFTLSQVELWLEATKGAENATQAIEMYEAALSDTNNMESDDRPVSLSISDTIDKLNTQLKPAFDSLHSTYQNIFTDGESLDLNSVDILSTCDSIKSKLDELNKMEGITVDNSSFEDFVRVLNNTESTEQDVKKAFDSLATSIAHAALNGTENFDTMKAALEDLDVVNSAMIAFDKFTNNAELLEDAIKQANLTMNEFAMSTDDGKLQASEAAMAFLEEMVGAENCAQALALLQLKQILINQSTITTADDCQNILDLATSANIGIIKLQQLQTLMDMITRRNSAIASGDSRAASELNRAIHEYSANAVSNLKADDLDVDFSSIGGGKTAAGNAGKSAGRSYKDALKEELSNLDNIISGVTKSIDDQISTINEQKSSALDALDAEKDALEEAKDTAVEALEAERDARLEVIETQKKQLEEQVNLIDKQIDQKQDEIDAINAAADARQRELDLQKAQYELERMQNQNTILQYSESEGMHYVQDTSGVRDAKEQVDEANRQIEIAGIEKEIDLLENEKDLINEQIDLLDEQADLINSFYDAEIEKVEKFYDDQIKAIENQRAETESYFESIIQNLEDSKSKYEELTSIVDKAELSAKLKQLGIDEAALLNGSEEEFQKLKDTYMGIVSQLNEGNDTVISSLQSLSGYAGTAPALLSDSQTELDEMNGKLDESNQSIGDMNDSLTDTTSKTTTIATNVGTIADGLNQIPDSQTITDLSVAFDTLAESINSVAKALGLSEESEIGTLAQAISDLNSITLDSETEGIIAQFTNLKTAIDSVTSAISGGGGESSDSESQSGNASKGGGTHGKDSKGESSGGGSLTDAITSMGETAAKVIGEPDAEGDGTVIGEFGSLKTAVGNVTSAVGTGESEDGKGKGGGEPSGKDKKGEDSGNLIGSIVNLGETTDETLGEPGGDGVIGKFEKFKDVIGEAAAHVGSIYQGLIDIDGKTAECTITVNVNQNGNAYADGTLLSSMNLNSGAYTAQYGKALANGTGKYKGLPKAERNALVSEYGQTEMTVFPNGNTVITTDPTIMDLPKGTVIFNENQTGQLMRNKIHVDSASYTDRTTDNIQPAASKEFRIIPFQPNDQMYAYVQKWNAYFSNNNQTAALMPSSMYERSQQLYNGANQITNSAITNKNQPSVHVGDIHINCPGVTSKEVAKQVGVELNHMFNGLHLDADQQSRLR